MHVMNAQFWLKTHAHLEYQFELYNTIIQVIEIKKFKKTFHFSLFNMKFMWSRVSLHQEIIKYIIRECMLASC